MNYASLLVHVPESAQREAITRTALELSARFGAHLTALHVHLPSFHSYVAYGEYPYWPSPQTLCRETEEAAQRDNRLKTEFKTLADRFENVPTEWRHHRSEMAESILAETIARHARGMDLVVMGQHDPDDQASQISYDTPALVALHSARPTLILPSAVPGETLGQRIVFAWNASREATHAALAALPLLVQAASVEVVVAENGESIISVNGEAPGADIARYLSRHGATVSVSRIACDKADASQVLLDRVAATNADLLCMGAYGHSRLREMVFGGATYDLMRDMPVPTLIAC